MRLFSVIDTSFNKFDTTISQFLSKAFNSIGVSYSHGQIYDIVFTGIKNVMQNIMFYIEDAFTEQNVFTASRKSSLYSLARISGFEPYFGSAAVGVITAKTIITNGLQNSATKLYINNYSTIQNKYTGVQYVLWMPISRYVFDISKPLVSHDIKIVQGSYITHKTLATGEALFVVNLELLNLWDRDYVKVYVNGTEWTQAGTLYDMGTNEEQYLVKVGFNNTLEIMFGNGTYGKIPAQGSTIEVKYISHSGESGNIADISSANFVFYDSGFDSFGNSVNLNDYIKLSLGSIVSGGRDADSIDFVRSMIGKNSRSNVLASADSFNLFFKRFSFIGYCNCWSESNSMTVTAVCMSNAMNYISEPEEYMSMDTNKLLLNDTQKEMVTNTLNNSNKAFAGITLKFQDPIIRKYAIRCYVKVDDVYVRDTVKTNIKNAIANYFMNIEHNVLFIPKSDIINCITASDENISAADIEIISGLAEDCYYKGYYYKYVYKLVNDTYEYVPTKVYYEADSKPGMDIYGNIELSSKLEMPVLNGSFKYYPNKSDGDKNTNISMSAVEIFFM